MTAARIVVTAAAVLMGASAGHAAPREYLQRINVIDGADDRGSLLTVGPALGLSPDEIERIRKVSGYVGCLSPSPSVGSAALFLSNRQILTAAHIFFEPSGRMRSRCFFKNQDRQPIMIDLVLDRGATKFGATRPRPGSNSDYAIVGLKEPLPGAEPFPVEDGIPVANGDALIVVTAHPAGMEPAMDNSVPVVQGCAVRRAVKAQPMGSTSFYRSDCDATGASSGGMHLSRVGGRLLFRGITITTGPWQQHRLAGAPYDEKKGSVTTALGTDAAILRDGRSLMAGGH